MKKINKDYKKVYRHKNLDNIIKSVYNIRYFLKNIQ